MFRRIPLGPVLWLLGLAVIGWLLWQHGLCELAATLGEAGWSLLLVPAFALLPLACHSIGWYCLLDAGDRPSLKRVFAVRWIGGTVKDLLPVVKVGGDVLRAGMLAQQGVATPRAAASVVADVTAGVSTQLGFALLGLALLLQRPDTGSTAAAIFTGILLFAAALVAFYLLQRAGMFRRMANLLRGVGGKNGQAVGEGTAAMDAALQGVYARRGVFFRAAAWRFAGWFLGAGEIWLAMQLLGQPIGLAAAIVLESLLQFLRSVAFMVPGAMGVQEGGLILLGSLFGLPPDAALTLSAVKRLREAALGLGAVLLWFWLRSRSPSATALSPSVE